MDSNADWNGPLGCSKQELTWDLLEPKGEISWLAPRLRFDPVILIFLSDRLAI